MDYEKSSFDHDVPRIVAGDAESLRARLADALEQMGYRVLNENPIQARRGASGLAWRFFWRGYGG